MTFDGCLDAELLRRYALATNDPSPRVRAGAAVPPVAVVTQIWEAQQAAQASVVPEEVRRRATAGVHGEHDIVLHRQVVPGERLRTSVAPHGVRTAGANALVTARYVTRDDRGAVVAEQWWTTVYRGGAPCAAAGEPAPDHAFPSGARERPLGTYEVLVDGDMARRYAEVSGDWSAHHFDVDAARRTGFGRVFVHGLCTMALCAQAVVELAAGGDVERVRRIAVRFAAPVFLGDTLDVSVYDAGPRLGVAFEATSGGSTVITHGRAEIRSLPQGGP